MITSLEKFIRKFDQIPKSHMTLIVGIDGGGAAGKSTLAAKLQELDNRVTVVHMDDFYRPSWERKFIDEETIGGNWDWERVRNQVLNPLRNNEPSRYQIYDWVSDKMTDLYEVPIGGIVIVEGCYSIRNELAPLYDVRIWVESPREFRLERGVQRDGDVSRHMWENIWLPAEDRYFELQRPSERADVIIDGTGQEGDISNFEVNVVYESDKWLSL